MKNIPVPYKPAKLYCKTDDWYVFYSFVNPVTKKFQRFKERFDINRIKDAAKKKAYGMEMCQFINEKLANGFNPFEIKEISENTAGNLLHDIDNLFDIISYKNTDQQRRTYICMINRFKNYIKENDLQQYSMARIDSTKAKDFQKWLSCKKLSVKTINSTISHISMFWDTAIEKKMCLLNPFKNVTRIKKNVDSVDQEDIFEPITFDELKSIKKFLFDKKLQNYWRFLSMIYMAWARPVEICRLKVSDVILNDSLLRFRKTETKNNKASFVQILPGLKELLLQMNLQDYPSNFFLFSTEDYMPGSKQKDPERPGEQWKWHVIKKLGINKKMYALKHTGNIEYLLNNKGKTDLKWQQTQNRHSSAEITQRYNRKLGAYFIDTQNIKFREL